jgi:CRP-like cAMP-binding protein
MPDHLIRKLELRDQLSEDEKKVLRSVIGPPRPVPAHVALVREGDRPTESILLLEGYTARVVELSEGHRQITSLHVPGDFIDLHGFLIKTMDHGIVSLGPCQVSRVPHAELRRITEHYPHLARLLWLTTLIDTAIQRRWMAAIGRQSALSRLAHLLCETYVRQKEVLLHAEGSVYLPMTQSVLSDVLGVSPVHTNRIIQEMREGGLVEWRGSVVVIKDWDRLADLGEFDPAYLNRFREPR